MKWRPETFAWYSLLSFTTFLRTETRYGRGIEGKGRECRVTESIKIPRPGAFSSFSDRGERCLPQIIHQYPNVFAVPPLVLITLPHAPIGQPRILTTSQFGQEIQK